MVWTTRKCNSVYSAQRAEDRLARDLKVDPIELKIAQHEGQERACETVGISRGQVVYTYICIIYMHLRISRVLS